jgi:PBP1b-binding outer membrane lipoprotein LpoB
MKKIFFLAGLALIWASCTNNSKTADTQVADSTKTSVANMKMDNKPDDKKIKSIKPVFVNVDAAVSSVMSKLTGDYMSLKNALVADDASGAADAAGTLSNDLKNPDKSKFTAEQKTPMKKTRMT